MTSQRPYTFADLEANAAPSGRWAPRPNTVVDLHGNEATVFLHGAPIAVMYSDGSVKLEARATMSNTVRNRLNDILLPLGWRLAISPLTRLVSTDPKQYEVMEYTRSMIVKQRKSN